MSADSTDKPRRKFLVHSMTGAAAAASLGASAPSGAQTAGGSAPAAAPAAAEAAEGYRWLKPSEQGFVEALVNHMCPKDAYSPSGVDMGLNVYFDRTLGGEWGQGHRLYSKGPFRKGTPNQGYQLGLTPAELFRAGTVGVLQYCASRYGKTFEALSPADKEAVLLGLQRGTIALPNGVPAATYFGHVYQLFVEGMFADPIYGGNRQKAGWKMINYPGAATNNRQNIARFKNKPFKAEPLGIADVS